MGGMFNYFRKYNDTRNVSLVNGQKCIFTIPTTNENSF